VRPVEFFCSAGPESAPPDVLRRAMRRVDFDDTPLADETVSALEAVAKDAPASVRLVRDEAERAAVAEFVAEGDRLLFADPAYRFRIGARWRPDAPGEEATDDALLPMPDLFPGLGSFWVSAFDLGDLQARRDFRLAARAPLLVVVSGEETSAGRQTVLETTRRLVHAAEAEGLSASFFNQPILVPELRRRLVDRLGLPASPQALLGVGTVRSVPGP